MNEIDDITRRILDSQQSLFNSPILQETIKLHQQALFSQKLEEYHKQEMALTTKEIEDLIWSISLGNDTYKDLQSVVPRLNSATMCSYLVDSPDKNPNYRDISLLPKLDLNTPRKHYFQLKEIPPDFFQPYEFNPSDCFMLSVSGENVLYQLQKEKRSGELTSYSVKVAEESLSVAKESTRYARLAFYAAVIFGLLSLALSAKEELWRWLQLALGLSL